MIKIGFFDTKSYDRKSFEQNNKNYGFEIHYFSDRLSEESMQLANGMDAVCVFVDDNVNASVVRYLADSGVKLIALRCAGFNNVDLQAAQDKIAVVRVPAYSPHAVAEYAATLMLCLNRKVYRSVNRTREFNFKLDGLMGFDMYGKTVGIVGMGRIAKILIGILRGFGMHVLAYDVYPDMEFAKANDVEVVDLEEIYRRSDIISLHVPLTPRTRFMINRVSINKMKRGVMIINTGRGKLIHTEDLILGLRSGQISAAGLDVYEYEQNYFYEDWSDQMVNDDKLAILLSMPNVILTSHQAFFTREALQNIAQTTLDNVRLFFDKGEKPNEVKA
ncbi:MAG: 2-hydroxyacid dehydrogenase [Prevotella sp.]